jgi:ribosomal protein S18 acetylase RimI-like enzyme
MWWQARAMLEDRPGALAALAKRCGQEGVNILGLQVFPCLEGRVVDELVLHTSNNWTAEDVERLVRQDGVEEAVVAPCSPHVLEDQPVRYLRAAQRVMQDPKRLHEELCRTLGAAPGAYSLVIDDGDGQPVRLSRSVPFTDTEVARAKELRHLALLAPLSAAEAVVPVAGGPVSLRRGTAADVRALIAMHGRCSAETLYRRFHAPVSRLTSRMARSLLEPLDGFSIVLTAGDAVIGCGLVAPEGDSFEIGLVVEDGWQHQGHGNRLLAALVEAAVERGAETLTCYVQPDNEAVLGAIQRAGLRAHVSHVDGITACRIVVGGRVTAADTPRRRRTSRPLRGNLTIPLVTLLHERAELRPIFRAADHIDQAVRDGA